MSSYLQPLYDALRTRILAAWPDVADGGIWEVEHVSLIAWSDLGNALPYAVIAMRGIQSTGDWGMCNRSYLVTMDVYRVQVVGGPSGRLLPKLEEFRDDLYATPLSTGQLMPDPVAVPEMFNVTPNDRLNAKQLLVRAGRVSFTVLVGDAAA